MKKTIIALLALGSVAMAEETVTLFDFNADKLNAFAAGYGADAVPFYMDIANGITVTVNASTGYTLGSGAWGSAPTITSGNVVLNDWIGADITSTAATYITGGARNANADLSITLSGLEAGGAYNVALLTAVPFEVGGAWNDIITTNAYTSANRELGGEKIDVRAVAGFAITEMIASEDGTISFTINSRGAHTAAINGIAITETPAVPEPTTATLSLLALAGLAARRRRK